MELIEEEVAREYVRKKYVSRAFYCGGADGGESPASVPTPLLQIQGKRFHE